MNFGENALYIAPEIDAKRFTCPYCNTIAEQKWDRCTFIKTVDGYDELKYKNYTAYPNNESYKGERVRIKVSTCQSCFKPHVWIDNTMIQPKDSNVPVANADMPEKVKEVYDEAREVFPVSARAAAALLRLALQHLCIELGEKGKNINVDISEMVKKGLPVEIQQALDIVRVVGNNAVHPGELNLNDNKEIAIMLFNIVNFIVDNRIVQPKKIEAFYNSLPKGALDGINSRDK